ncbi:hypothetical protein Lal_00005237 [Lupinus albus]|nr:hypothetical protein Lal_00005237 [Lupinus albus]
MGLIIISVLLCVGSLNLTDIVRAQEKVWFCIPLLPMFVMFFISALAETNRAPFDLPEGESELVAGFMLRSLRALLPWRIRQHDPDERDDQHPVPRWLAAPAALRTLHLGAWHRVVRPEDRVLPVHLRLGSRHRAALPLRPADAAGLEGLPAAVAVLGRADRRCAGDLRLAAEISGTPAKASLHRTHH